MIAERIGMDDIDCTIVGLLQKEPNLTHSQIAKIVNRSQPTIGARIKKLEKAGVLKYQAGINMKVADLCFGRVELQTNNPQDAIELVQHCPFMLNALRLGGENNLSIFLVGLNYKDLDHIVNRHFRNNPNVVNAHIDVIVDVASDFVLQVDLNLEFGELTLQKVCCEKCDC
jgi:Lrp/AsnC family leucine-responsive transcriptional regulator